MTNTASEFPELQRPKTEVTHYFSDGKTACHYSAEHGQPTIQWERGHVWSRRWPDVTCTDCLAAKPESE